MTDIDPTPQETEPPAQQDPKPPAATRSNTFKTALADLPRAKQVMLALAALFVLVGFGLSMAGGQQEAPADDAEPSLENGESTVPATGLVGGNGAPKVQGAGHEGAPGSESETGAATSGASSWSPFFVKGGFSFVLAFCIGYALRMFFKFTALIVGVYALGLFGLVYIGWVDVEWHAISAWWDGLIGHVQGQAASFKTFVTGSLPSAGLGTAGLITGFRKG